MLFISFRRGCVGRWRPLRLGLRIGLRAAAFVCLVLVKVQSHAEPSLGFEQALQLAQERSLALSAQDVAASASREMAVAAGQRPDPTLKVGINNLPINGGDRFSLARDFMTMRSVGVMQELTRSDKLKARSARFEREAGMAEAAKTLALVNLRRDTAMAWLDRYFQERMLGLLQAQKAEASLQVDAADAAYRGGRGAQAEALGARSAVAQIDDRIRLTQRQIATATTRLARWVGEAGKKSLGAAPSLLNVRLDESNVEQHLAHHPELAMMLRQEEVARAEAEIARSNQRADWSVEWTVSQRGSQYSDMASINLSIPLQLNQKDLQHRELAAKLAVADQLRAQREDAFREHVAEATSWLQAWQSDRERLAQYDAALIPLAAQRTRAGLAAYRGGSNSSSASLGSVLEARRMEIELRIERLQIEMEAGSLWAQLEYLLPPGHDAASLAHEPMQTPPEPQTSQISQTVPTLKEPTEPPTSPSFTLPAEK